MSHKIIQEDKGDGLVVTFRGEISGSEIFDVNKEIIEDESYYHHKYQIWDYSDVESLGISVSEIKQIAVQDSFLFKKNPNMLLAIVDRQNVMSEARKKYELYVKVWTGFKRKVFSSIEDARNWIGTNNS